MSRTAAATSPLKARADGLLARPPSRAALAQAFPVSRAASAEVLVGGTSFYPPMLDDIGSATSSIHINQFGFTPGIVGDAFAEALLAKAADGVRVRLVVDNRGSAPAPASRTTSTTVVIPTSPTAE